MERHNRKSYLAPPAPKSLKEGTTPTSNTPSSAAAPTPAPASVSKATPTTIIPMRTPQLSQPSPYQQSPASGEVPLNNANDVSTPHRYYGHQGHHYTSSRSARSPPTPSLEHLSLETRDDDESRSGRRPTRHLGDPVSAVEATSRPWMSPRSVSSHNTKSRTNLNPAALPIRAAPPPNGPPPPPPVSAGGNRRDYPSQTPGATS